MLYYKMKTEQIVMCVVALALGMLVANMLTNVCGCKTTEGYDPDGLDLTPSGSIHRISSNLPPAIRNCGNPNDSLCDAISGWTSFRSIPNCDPRSQRLLWNDRDTLSTECNERPTCDQCRAENPGEACSNFRDSNFNCTGCPTCNPRGNNSSGNCPRGFTNTGLTEGRCPPPPPSPGGGN